MRAELEDVFRGRNVIPCISSDNRNVFFIDDPANKCSEIIRYDFHKEVEPILFKVENTTGKQVYLLAIDKCLIGRAVPQQRCDFALFDDNSFCLVEMKMNAESTEEDLTAQDIRSRAKRQLGETINFFRREFNNKGKMFIYGWIEAIIAIPLTFPRSPGIKPKFAEDFFIEYSIPIYESSMKKFD